MGRQTLAADTRGATMVEYLIVVAVVGVAAIAGWRLFGSTVEGETDEQGERIATMQGAGASAVPGVPGGVVSPEAFASTATPGEDVGGSSGALTSGSAPPSGAPSGSPPSGAAPSGTPPDPSDGGDDDGGGSWWDRTTSGIGNFFEGAIKGDFAGDTGWAGVGGQVVVGLIPIVGQAADVRDVTANFDAWRNGEPGAGVGMLAAGVGFIPGVGDGLKGLIKGGRQAARGADAAATIGRRSADEAVGRLPKHLRNKMKRIRNELAAGGNRGVSGTLSRGDADRLGESFLGPGYTISSDGKAFVSADGLRQYRPPTPKRGIDPVTGEPYSRTGVQANFQSRGEASGPWQNNVHIDVDP